MRSGGSVLKALSAAEGALPREYEHEAVWYTPTPRILSTEPLDASPPPEHEHEATYALAARGIIAL